MSDPFPVFDAKGNMLGNMTSNWGQVPTQSSDFTPNFAQEFGAFPTLPAISSSFAPSSTSPGNTVTSQGSAGGAPLSLSAPGSTFTTPSNAQAGAQPAPSSGIVSGSLADYFYRVVIVVLGFIFVAIGLNMFKPGLVPIPGIPGRK